MILGLGYVAAGLAITSACFMYYEQVWGTYARFNTSIEFCDITFCDFALYYYKQAKVVVDSSAPIYKYFYSPTFALFVAPLTRLSLADATVVWGWVQGAGLAVYVLSGVCLLSRRQRWFHAAFLVLALTSYPILNNWKWGQANTLFVGLAMLSIALRNTRVSGLAALPLALATASRYFPAVYVLAFFRRRRWPFLAWFIVLSLALLFLVPAVVMGFDDTWAFYEASAKMSAKATATWIARSKGSQYMPTVVARVVAGQLSDQALTRSVLTWLSWAIALAHAGFALRALRKPWDSEPLWSFCFIAGATPFLLPTSWMHYFVYLPVVQAFLLSQILDRDRRPIWRTVAMLAIWAAAAFTSSIFWFNAVASPGRYAASGVLLLSSATMSALTAVLFYEAGRAERALPRFVGA